MYADFEKKILKIYIKIAQTRRIYANRIYKINNGKLYKKYIKILY